MTGPHESWLPAAPESIRRNLADVLADLTIDQIADRLAGFRTLADSLPAGDAMRPAVETLRDVLAAELAGRIRDRAHPRD